ncbi:hypothetical protein L1987_29580 [Smallanthus sonchifolius]|uniref:Uncharacterized protein n=1 Tax=Smallanthus sonchifolius TaxID=185202 RepID=A0ACB9I1U6_9ASTR|nr:hypothetical protein L1987_29580 [Smallanthus sonchifolius]
MFRFVFELFFNTIISLFQSLVYNLFNAITFADVSSLCALIGIWVTVREGASHRCGIILFQEMGPTTEDELRNERSLLFMEGKNIGGRLTVAEPENLMVKDAIS